MQDRVAARISTNGQAPVCRGSIPKGHAAEGGLFPEEDAPGRRVNSPATVIRHTDGELSAFCEYFAAGVKNPICDIIVQNQPVFQPLISFYIQISIFPMPIGRLCRVRNRHFAAYNH